MQDHCGFSRHSANASCTRFVRLRGPAPRRQGAAGRSDGTSCAGEARAGRGLPRASTSRHWTCTRRRCRGAVDIPGRVLVADPTALTLNLQSQTQQLRQRHVRFARHNHVQKRRRSRAMPQASVSYLGDNVMDSTARCSTSASSSMRKP